MNNFLEYLGEFQEVKPNHKTKFVKKEASMNTNANVNKPKVLCMNVEIRTVEGAQKVIDKLQEWISRQEIKEYFEVKESVRPISNVNKQSNKPSKKNIQIPTKQIKSHACEILEGINDNVIINEHLHETNINNHEQFSQMSTMDSVAGHASALL